MKKIYFIFLLSFFLSCTKGLQYYDNTSAASKLILPPYSEDGANTFGFLMNDSVWTVFGKKYFGDMFTPASWHDNGVAVGYDTTNFPGRKAISIYGEMTIVKQNSILKDYRATLSFFPDSPFLKNYLLSSSLNSQSSGSFSLIKGYENFTMIDRYYFIDSTKPFIVQLTKYDTVAKICSGRFYGALNSYGDSIIIQDGRFDVKFY